MTARQHHAKVLRAENLLCAVWGKYRTADWKDRSRRTILLDRYLHLRRCFVDNLFSLTALAERHERGR